MDVYWWGLRDVNITRKPCVVLEIDDLTLKSDVIVDYKANCNFPKGRISEVFESLISDIYVPTLSVRLYDSSTFGRTLFLGTNVVNHPTKYIVNWLSQNEREKSLHTASIFSNNFYQSEFLVNTIKNSIQGGLFFHFYALIARSSRLGHHSSLHAIFTRRSQKATDLFILFVKFHMSVSFF